MSSVADGPREPLVAVIARLLLQGLDRHVDLPHIVLCANRTGFKDTVVEALGMWGVLFSMIPRSVTEVILVHSEKPHARVTIAPSAARSVEQIERLKLFRRTIDKENRFRSTVRAMDDVKSELELSPIDDNGECDIVRFETRFSNAGDLSFVDLPSLAPHGKSVGDSSTYTKEMERFALRYMRNPRNMVLVVLDDAWVDKRYDVFRLAHECDPHGHRSFGLVFNSKKAKGKRLEKARASHLKLGCRFGWHVMQQNPSADRANIVDAWSHMEPDCLQSLPLKDCLGRAFREHTERELPGIVADIETALRDRRADLELVNSSCASAETQRRLLFDFSTKFTSLITAGAHGVYTDPFFISSEKDVSESPPLRLRGVVNELLVEAERELRDSFANQGRQLDLKDDKGPAAAAVLGPKSQADHEVESLGEQLRRHQVHELPGTLNSAAVWALIADTCRPWKSILKKSVERIATAVEAITSEMVASTADHRIKHAVSHAVSLALEDLVLDLGSKTTELLAPYCSANPITCSQHIAEAVRKSQQSRTKERLQKLLEGIGLDKSSHRVFFELDTELLLDDLTSHVEEELRQQPIASAMDYAKAYCEVGGCHFDFFSSCVQTTDNHISSGAFRPA